MGHSVNDTGPPNPPSSCRRRRHTCPCLLRCGGGGGGMWALAWCGGGRCSSGGKVEFNWMDKSHAPNRGKLDFVVSTQS